jgi:serine/threonine protein kinase
MAYDKKANAVGRPEFVALKVQKSAPHYREAALDEIELLNSVTSTLQAPAVINEHGNNFDPCVVLLYDSFDHVGTNGKHMCMTFEILGENLLKVIKKFDYQGIPIKIVRNMVRQICVGLDYLHRHCSIIHTDLKPENVLISTPPPIPDMAEVRLLVASTPSAAGKKSKQAQKPPVSSSASEAACKSEQMTSEQKKSMKKKLKKRRQQDRKKGKDKGGRRKVSEKSSREEDANALKEMIMMELGSIPSEISSEENTQIVERLTKQYADAGLLLNALPADENNSLLLAPSTNPSKVFRDTAPFVGEHITPGRSHADEGDLAPPAWQRPTLFSFLNFCASGDVESVPHTSEAKDLASGHGAEVISKDDFVPIDSSEAGRFCMVRSLFKFPCRCSWLVYVGGVLGKDANNIWPV